MKRTTGRKSESAAHNVPANRAASINEAIRRRAYELYEERGREDGRDLEDWYRAEAEVVQRNARAAAA